MSNKASVSKIWEVSSKEKLPTAAIALYFYISEKWNNAEKKEVEITNPEIIDNMGISKPTIRICRNLLKKHNLITYIVTKGKKTNYSIIQTFTPEPEPSEILKTPELKCKPNKQTKKARKEKKEPKMELPPGVPTEAEFLEYAETLDAYLPENRNVIIENYRAWLKNNWNNDFNKPIRKWKISLASALPYWMSDEKVDAKLPNITKL